MLNSISAEFKVLQIQTWPAPIRSNSCSVYVCYVHTYVVSISDFEVNRSKKWFGTAVFEEDILNISSWSWQLKLIFIFLSSLICCLKYFKCWFEYSHLPNKRAPPNKRTGWDFLEKVLSNRADPNKRAGLDIFFKSAKRADPNT